MGDYFARKDAKSAKEAQELDVLRDNAAIEVSEKLFAWRRDEFLRMGFQWDLAVRMAKDTRIDLHEVASLLEKGCPHEVAVDIVT